MKYPIGKSLVLLESMDFKGGGVGKPVAVAEILSFNPLSERYKIRYTVYVSGETGETEVPEGRLYSPVDELHSI